MNLADPTSNRARETGREIAWLAGTLFLVFLYYLPILAGWYGIFTDDVRTINFPNAFFQARNLKEGIIPLWDPHTFAGGMPFYTRVEAFPFYLPQWLIAWAGSIADLDSAYRSLTLFPIILHCLWGAAGGFVLGRWGIKLSRPGSAAVALTFALSSSTTGALLCAPMAMSLPWLPWMAAAALLYIRRPAGGRFFLGLGIIALAIPSWSNYVTQGFLLIVLFAAVGLLERRTDRIRIGTGRTAAGLIAMIALAWILNAPNFFSLIDAAGYVQKTMPLNYSFLTDGPRSVPWRWLATIFVPELFASTNFEFFWGVAADREMFYCEATISRGMLLWLPAALALWAGLRLAARRARGRKDPVSSLDLWTWSATGLLLLSLILLLGRYTPLFKLLYRLFPVFRIPYATRWHTFLTVSLALLSGIGVDRLISGGLTATRRHLLAYLGLATLAALATVTLPPGYWGRLPDWGWFAANPLLYWGLGAAALLWLCLWWKPRRAAAAVIILFLLDLFRCGALETYRPAAVTWAPEQDRGNCPSRTGLYRFMERAAFFDNDPLARTGYSRPFVDGGALVYGGQSLLGVSTKPMLPRLFAALAQVSEGMPYEIALMRGPSSFVRNMSTGYWWYDSPTPPEADWEPVSRAPESGLYLFRIPGQLPRVFTLDRFQPEDEEGQRWMLLGGDLRQGVIIDSGDSTALRYLPGRMGLAPGEDPLSHFYRLQRENPVTRSDFTHPHRVLVELEVAVPSMLVVTDAWHPGWQAAVDGRTVPLHRVNYLQRGIWLERGNHRVEMRFQPGCITVGRWLSLAGAGLALLILLFRRRLFPLPAFNGDSADGRTSGKSRSGGGG